MKYKEAGVDIKAGEEFAKHIKKLSDKVGGFGGLFEVPRGYTNPMLVGSVDSVGTKLKIAFQLGIHNTIGQDIVNHCVNDILAVGATPLYFMDYIGTSKLDLKDQKGVIEGVVKACEENGIVLLGGETAELPGFYNPTEYDLVGSITGIVEKENVIDGQSIIAGDKLVALPSNGLHTNGYSLVRGIIEDRKLKLDMYVEDFGHTLGEELLRVHRSYLDMILPLIQKVKGLIHVTGGGFYGNIPRVMPAGIGARVHKDSWEIPPIFKFIQCEGDVEEEEMFNVFNMGAGMIAVVDDPSLFEGVKESWVIGETTGTGKIQIN
jgi:phosphoribosylformylglycinamidine cyclo-ligase